MYNIGLHDLIRFKAYGIWRGEFANQSIALKPCRNLNDVVEIVIICNKLQVLYCMVHSIYY